MVRRIREILADGALGGERIAQFSKTFDAEIEPHFNIEEELLLPQLNSLIGRELADRTLAEHRMLRELVGAVREGNVAALRAFADTLEAHVRFEERELYPAFESVVSAPVLELIALRAPKHVE